MPNSRVPPRTCGLVFAALVGVAAVASAAGDARAAVSDDRQVCYKGVFKDKASQQYRFVLDVGFHSPLVSERDEGGFPQATYIALGKHVASDRSYKDVHMDVANGAIIVTDKGSESGNYQSGAHMAWRSSVCATTGIPPSMTARRRRKARRRTPGSARSTRTGRLLI